MSFFCRQVKELKMNNTKKGQSGEHPPIFLANRHLVFDTQWFSRYQTNSQGNSSSSSSFISLVPLSFMVSNILGPGKNRWPKFGIRHGSHAAANNNNNNNNKPIAKSNIQHPTSITITITWLSSFSAQVSGPLSALESPLT